MLQKKTPSAFAEGVFVYFFTRTRYGDMLATNSTTTTTSRLNPAIASTKATLLGRQNCGLLCV